MVRSEPVAITRAQRAAFRESIAPTLLEGVRELVSLKDLGERELESADLLPAALVEERDLLGEALDVVAEAPRGAEVLAALAIAAPTPVSVGARVRLEEVDELPAAPGPLSVEEAWEMVAGDDPVYALFLLCGRERAKGSQLFSFTIETLASGGAVKDAWATGLDEGAAMAKRLTGKLPEEEVVVRLLAPAEAQARIVAAAEQGARTGLMPTEDGLHVLSAWLRASGHPDADAIVQALELGETSIQELDDEAVAAAIEELAEEAEAWATASGAAPEDAGSLRFVAGLMGDFIANHLGLGLTDWGEGDLDEFLLDWVPRKVSLSGEEATRLPGEVRDVFRFLAESDRLDRDVSAALGAKAMAHSETFVAAMADPALRGPARAVLDAMAADGVELGDEEAMQAWIESFNALSTEERDEILGPLSLPGATPPTTPRAGKPKPKSRKAQKQARKKNRRR